MKQKSIKTAAPYGALLVLALAVPAALHSAYWLGIFILVLYQVIGSCSLRTISLSGNLTFSHGAFIALGAYCAGILAKNLALPPVVTILAGGLFAALVAVVTGFPFVRLKGLYYSMASMFLGVTFIYIIKAMDITGGYRGLTGIPAMFSSPLVSYYFFVILTVVCLAVLYRFEHSRIGTTLTIAGAAYALYATVLSTTNYDMTFSLWLLMYMMIGGENRFIGPIIGTIIFVLIPEVARGLSEYAPYITGLCTLLVAYLLPGGLAGIPSLIRARREARVDNAAEKGGARNEAS